MPIPSTFKYTPEEFEALINECIDKCKDSEDDYQPCPEQLYQHTSLSKQAISRYRMAKEDESSYPYKPAADKFYNYLGIFACKDNLDGNGKQGAHLYNRVLKYSEKQIIDTNVTATVKMDKVKINGKDLTLDT